MSYLCTLCFHYAYSWRERYFVTTCDSLFKDSASLIWKASIVPFVDAEPGLYCIVLFNVESVLVTLLYETYC